MSDAFNRDIYLAASFEKLIAEKGIEVVVETGTYHGVSTEAFAQMAPSAHTIEVNPTYFAEATERLNQYDNVTRHLGNSPDVLDFLLPNNKDKAILFFLDAHWEGYCPLIDELKAIAKAGIQPIIAIHDFKVPGTDFGYDTYNGQPYELAWVEPHLHEIYPNGFSYYYNTETTGARRGCIFIEPKH